MVACFDLFGSAPGVGPPREGVVRVRLLEQLALGLFRVRRYVAPAVLVLSFAVTQVLFRMPEDGLEAGCWLLAPHVLLASAFLWPLALGRRDPASVRVGIVGALSAATVLVTLFAIPLWAGHGCWAPDLQCFAVFLLAGLVLALVLSPLGARRLGSLQDRRVGRILALFLFTFFLGVGVTLARAYQARPPAAAGPRPEVLWSRTPREGLWAYLTPRPWVDAGYAPADPAVGGDVVVFVGTLEQVDILNCRDGTTLWSATVEPPVRPLRSDTARNVWTRPVVSGGHVLLRPRGGTPLLILDSGSRRVQRVDFGEPAVEVLPSEGGGFFVLTPDRLCLLDGRGTVVWSYRPQVPGSSGETVKFSVNEFSPAGLRRRLVSTPGGLVCMSPDWLCLCDVQTGEARWLKFPRGRFAGMQVSPSGDVVYVAEAGSQGRRIIAYDSDGTPMWSRELPAECYGIVWSAAPDGLLVCARLPEAGAAECIGRDGQTRYWLPIPERDPVSVRYLRGVFLVASHHRVSAYRAADGHHVWTITEPPVSRLPGGYRYYVNWAVVGADLVIPCAAGLSAHDLLTGSLRWVYTPPGGFFGMAASSDAVYVTSGRGLFALRCR